MTKSDLFQRKGVRVFKGMNDDPRIVRAEQNIDELINTGNLTQKYGIAPRGKDIMKHVGFK